MKGTPSISLVLPGLNEEANIEETVRRGLEALGELAERFEIVIVDDGSTDGTAAIADRLAAESPAVRVIHNPVNLGAGTSVLIGMRAARHELIVHDSMDYPSTCATWAGCCRCFRSTTSWR